MHTDVYTLKTPLDTLSWLCLLESELLSIRAFQRLDLHTDRDETNELTFLDELGKEINRPFWEKAVDEGIQDARCDRAIAALERM